jgi:ABC-2 type transport system permease protein
MRAWTICKKELKAYLYSPVAYIASAFFLLVSGFFFYNILVYINQAQSMAMQYGQAQAINLNQMLYAPLFSNVTVVLMFLLPMLTMRLFADEKRMRTEEMLFTAPIRTGSIILGKFLAALIVYAAILLLTGVFSLFTFAYGTPQLAPVLTAYLGLFLMGAVFISIGLLASSLTENQAIAAVIAFSTILLIWVISWIGESAGPSWRGLLTYLSFSGHFQSLTQGVLDTQDLVYYVSFTFMNLYLTYSIFEFRKWR